MAVVVQPENLILQLSLEVCVKTHTRGGIFPRSPVCQVPRESGSVDSVPPCAACTSPVALPSQSAPRRPLALRVQVCAARLLSAFPSSPFTLCVCVFSHSVVSGSVTPRPVARQAPLSTGFSRQEDWRGLPFLPPGQRPNPGMEVTSPASPALQADSLPLTTVEGHPFLGGALVSVLLNEPVALL